MKVAVFAPKSEFSLEQQKRLIALGEIKYSSARDEYPIEGLITLSKKAHVLAVDPDNLGGFEKARERLTQVMETLPDLRGVALSTTSSGWIDLEYCKRRGISVSNIPGYSRNTVAELTIAYLMCIAKRIIETDRATQRGRYELKMGYELQGKTLGIIGLGSIGSRVAKLAKGLGMKVIAWNRSPKKQAGVAMVSLSELYNSADAISLHLTDCAQTQRFIGQKELNQMKPGVMIVNTAYRDLVDESAMAKVLKLGKIWGYAYEGEDLKNTPLANIDTAIGLKGFGWYTKEALTNLMNIWVDNIIALVQGKPQHVII